ncbi:hypothetical protein B0H63DRAFT_481238 [Podospora didyma]|uniref:Uncharacterized protein n=1 Tax=Podospora didyma TaxID=330526 RepID=A0AAE0KE16_9PEZI|nr:hypothetical protein B0H63DRAFT_481238 [Podospora didyma]
MQESSTCIYIRTTACTPPIDRKTHPGGKNKVQLEFSRSGRKQGTTWLFSTSSFRISTCNFDPKKCCCLVRSRHHPQEKNTSSLRNTSQTESPVRACVGEGRSETKMTSPMTPHTHQQLLANFPIPHIISSSPPFGAGWRGGGVWSVGDFNSYTTVSRKISMRPRSRFYVFLGAHPSRVFYSSQAKPRPPPRAGKPAAPHAHHTRTHTPCPSPVSSDFAPEPNQRKGPAG